MDQGVKAASICTAIASCAVVLSVVAGSDGRSTRKPISTKHSLRTSQWQDVLMNPEQFDGWFQINLRCNHRSFLSIVRLIESHWPEVLPLPGKNSYFKIKDRVAVTMHYLAHPGAFHQSTQVFGMGKASAIRYTWQVINVVNSQLLPIFVRLPRTDEEWQDMHQGFEAIGGFPNVAGAIDGSLIEIVRPADHEGWYCRKGYPAINFQAVCDYRRRFISFSIRPGSCSDQLIFNMSKFGRVDHKTIPNGFVWLADAGYKLTSLIMTPLPISDSMSRKEKNYNYIHSKTRIAIEGAFGMLKQRFRIFKQPLSHSTPERNADVLKTCIVLHNILIDLRDDAPLEEVLCDNTHVDQMQGHDQAVDQGGLHKRQSLINYLSRLYLFLCFLLILSSFMLFSTRNLKAFRSPFSFHLQFFVNCLSRPKSPSSQSFLRYPYPRSEVHLQAP
jgi:hypothetical protein